MHSITSHLQRRHRRSSRLVLGVTTIIVGLTLTPAVALADGPSVSYATGGEQAQATAIPMTSAQIKARNAKLQAMAAPTRAKQQQLAKSGKVAYILPPDDGGSWPNKIVLAAKPRHQYRMFYCGPATIQVISNYSWGFSDPSKDGQDAATNKYKQTTISSNWAHASSSSGTTIENLVDGLNAAVKTPMAGFYSVQQNPTWYQFHSAVMTDTYVYNLGLAAGVNPRKLGSQYFLTSWKDNTAKDSIGHYIPLRGYEGDAQSSALVYYSDSSGGQDEVDGTWIAGSTGNFVDPSFTVYKTMMNRYGNLAW